MGTSVLPANPFDDAGNPDPLTFQHPSTLHTLPCMWRQQTFRAALPSDGSPSGSGNGLPKVMAQGGMSGVSSVTVKLSKVVAAHPRIDLIRRGTFGTHSPPRARHYCRECEQTNRENGGWHLLIGWQERGNRPRESQGGKAVAAEMPRFGYVQRLTPFPRKTHLRDKAFYQRDPRTCPLEFLPRLLRPQRPSSLQARDGRADTFART